MDSPPQAAPDAAAAAAADAAADSALVLFAHGARDPRWALPLQRLQEALQRRQPRLRVEIAFLEMQAPALAPTLDALAAAGVHAIRIAPVFWSLGGHVARDLPEMIAAFRARHPHVSVDVGQVLAELPGMNDFLAQTLLDWALCPAAARP